MKLIEAQKGQADRKRSADTEKSGSDAYMSAMRILAAGDNSSRMLREKLTKKGFELAEIEEAIARLTEVGYVNDRRLAMRWGEMLAERKCCGAYKVRMELLRRFDREVVDCVMDELIENIDFALIARNFALKNAKKGREAIIRRLRYQGFTVSQIRTAVEGIPGLPRGVAP